MQVKSQEMNLGNFPQIEKQVTIKQLFIRSYRKVKKNIDIE